MLWYKRVASSLPENYLTNRKQSVRYEEVSSSLRNITTGVPQGSVLGKLTLLFIIYMNDIVAASDFFEYVIYADDATLFFSLRSQGTVDTSCINAELNKIHNWLAVNNLALNTNKSKYMVFHTKQKQVTAPILTINNKTIECVDEFNLLGIVVNKHLKWHSHINKVANKVSKTIGILNKLKNLVPKYTLLTIYNSVILPHLTYGILTWGFDCDRLLNLKKRAVRFITLSKYIARSESLFKQLNCLKNNDIIKANTLKYYFQLKTICSVLLCQYASCQTKRRSYL